MATLQPRTTRKKVRTSSPRIDAAEGLQGDTMASPGDAAPKKAFNYRYQTQFSDEEDDAPCRPSQEPHPIDAEWELYKTCTWKTYGDETSTCLDWWRAASVRMPYLARLVRWSWSCQASSCASERQFSRAGFINNRLRQGQTPATLWEASLLSNLLPDQHPQERFSDAGAPEFSPVATAGAGPSGVDPVEIEQNVEGGVSNVDNVQIADSLMRTP